MKHPQGFHINLTLLMVFFLMGICIDLYVPSLPAITQYFKTSQRLAQLTISLYMLGYGTGQIILGPLSDNLGRKKIMLPSAFLFFAASLGAALSPGILALLVFRVLQGVCIGGLASSVRAIASDCYSGIELVKVTNSMVISLALGPIIGPYIGGYLQHCFHWRADFYLFAGYGLFLFFYIMVFIPETNTRRTVFRMRETLSNFKTILAHRAFVEGGLVIALVYGSVVMFNVVGPYLIQNVLKYSVVAYGKIALCMGFGYCLGNLSNRALLKYWSPAKISSLGIICALATACAMILLSLFIKINLWIVVIPVGILFFFCGHVLPNIMGMLLGIFPKMGGTASAFVGVFLASGVFVLTVAATFLKTSSQKPLAVLYVTVMAVILVLFILARETFRKMAK